MAANAEAGATVVLVEAWLFAEFDSGVVVDTVAVLVITVELATVGTATTITTAAVAPVTIAPREALTVPALAAQLPTLVVQVRNEDPAGRASLNIDRKSTRLNSS